MLSLGGCFSFVGGSGGGLCKSVKTAEIASHQFVLTPGRYVGAEEVQDDGEPFEEKMKRLVATLEEQFAEGARLQTEIRTTRELNQAVKRNLERFPPDFMFQLTPEDAERSRSQSVILNRQLPELTQEATRSGPSTKRGSNVKYAPYAFTEQGVAVLSSVLRSDRAVQVNIEIMRAFVRLRQMLQANHELSRKLAALEKKYDAKFRIVFDAIRDLMDPPAKPKRRIGFRKEEP